MRQAEAGSARMKRRAAFAGSVSYQRPFPLPHPPSSPGSTGGIRTSTVPPREIPRSSRGMTGERGWVTPRGCRYQFEILNYDIIPTALIIDTRPFADPDRLDAAWVINQELPGVLASLNDGVVRVPNKCAQFIPAQVFRNCPGTPLACPGRHRESGLWSRLYQKNGAKWDQARPQT